MDKDKKYESDVYGYYLKRANYIIKNWKIISDWELYEDLFKRITDAIDIILNDSINHETKRNVCLLLDDYFWQVSVLRENDKKNIQTYYKNQEKNDDKIINKVIIEALINHLRRNKKVNG